MEAQGKCRWTVHRVKKGMGRMMAVLMTVSGCGGVSAAEVMQTPPQTSLQQLAQQAQVTPVEAPTPQRSTPTMGGH